MSNSCGLKGTCSSSESVSGTRRATKFSCTATVRIARCLSRELLYSPGPEREGAHSSTSTYLAKAVAQLIQQPIEYIVNRTFVAIEYEPTNAEITELLTTIHGEDTELVKWDDDMIREGCMAEDPIVSLGSAVLRKAGRGWWKFPGAERVDPIGWQTEGVEVQLRKQIET